MYRYAKDTKPGDAKGQGVGGTWFAVGPRRQEGAGGEAAARPYGDGGRAEAAADLAGLSVRKDPKLGEIIVDKNGMTVYRFKKDTAWPMKSRVHRRLPREVAGCRPGRQERHQGHHQEGLHDLQPSRRNQAADHRLLARSTPSRATPSPGDTNGQGVGGTWYAVSPEGKLVGAPK